MSGRVRLGELLVTSGILKREQLDQVLAFQQKDGRRLGKLLVERGLVTETQLTQILSQQLAIPWVSLYHIDFSRQLLELVPEEVAERFCLVPIFVRRVRGFGETLYVAMDDPTDETAIRAVSEGAGLPVRTMIAPPSDIRAAIRAYYGSAQSLSVLPEEGEELSADEVSTSVPPEDADPPTSPGPRATARASGAGRAPLPPTQAAVASAPSSSESAPLPAASSAAPYERSFSPMPQTYNSPIPERLVSAPPAELSSSELASLPPRDSSPTIEAREISMPAPPRRTARRMVTLTFLDGTRVNLPARTSRPPAGGEINEGGAKLTARDLIAALRAVSHGADASEILGDKARWEPMFAVLLELLLKKHLIADWEFVEEFKKI